jgi:hypothetical protein
MSAVPTVGGYRAELGGGAEFVLMDSNGLLTQYDPSLFASGTFQTDQTYLSTSVTAVAIT